VNTETLQSLLLALLFAGIFILGDRLRLPEGLARHQRKVLSFSAGISVAYVFVHLLPEVETARTLLVRLTADWSVPLPAYLVSLAALAGFMLFYGVDRLVTWRPATGGDTAGAEAGDGRLHVGIFAIYVAMVAYLRINTLEAGETPVWLFAVAMGTHFLTVSHTLIRDYGAPYVRTGRFVLAVAAIAGWALGAAAELPKALMVLPLAALAGAIIAISLIEELPRENEGRFWSFLAGGVLYAAILVPLA
jgi:zinc transporter ZupT